MPSYIKNRISLKIAIPLIGILAAIMTIFTIALVRQQTKMLETLIFTKARSLVLVGVRSMEHTLRDAIEQGVFSEAELLDVQYRKIVDGPLAGTQIPKYHTVYDTFLDQTIRKTLDAFVEEDPAIVFAVLVDRNGYLPTHNSRYAQPLTGDPVKDRNNNRTKRIFNDPVGLTAATFESTPEQPVLLQVYRRDTGETMWDISAPVHLGGKHWGAFRIGLSMAETETSILHLRLTIGLAMLALLAVASLTIVIVVKRRLRPLEQVTASARDIAAGHLDQGGEINIDSVDEIGTLVRAFNDMSKQLRQTTISRDYYDRIVASMHEALMIVSHEGLIQSANQATCNLLGYTANELSNQPVTLILTGDGGSEKAIPFDIRRFSKPRHITADKGQRSPVLVAKDGRKIPVSLSSSPLLDETGDVKALIWVAQDITQSRRLEQHLKQALENARRMAIDLETRNAQLTTHKTELEKAYGELKASQSIILQQEKMASIGQLAAGVAHEVNNPIGFISSNLNSLGKYIEKLMAFLETQNRACASLPDGPLKEEVEALRKKIKLDFVLDDSRALIMESLDGTERVRKIVQGLKTFSRTDQMDQNLADLNECLESTINIVWNELKYKATLHRDYGPLPQTLCYPQKLNQVFMNLLVNAAQAIEKQGEITVKTRHENGRIHIWITDTGSGIKPEHLKKIFEPFFTTKEVGKGTGLGMSIAYDIIKQHEGTISVSSEVGKGTTFLIDLPLVER